MIEGEPYVVKHVGHHLGGDQPLDPAAHRGFLDHMAAYRVALEGRGVSTAGWWDRQLGLALLGGFLQLGWSKTGDPEELAWWERRVLPVARELTA